MNDLVLLDLQTDISVGNITTNAALLLEAVKHGVAKYHDPNYIPDETAAKKDRAELNRADKLVAEKAREVKGKWNEPLETFDGLVAEIRTTIKNASGVVDGSVKKYEEKQKTAKREEIKKYFASKKFELVPLEKIFDQRWLNKGTKMKDIHTEIDAAIAKIYQDIEVLERIPDHGTAAKAFYLQTLDMGAALRQIDTLKENAARIAREQASREARKAQEQCEANDKIERQEKVEAFNEEKSQNLIDQALDLPEGTTAAKERKEKIKQTLEFEDDREKLMNIKHYMTSQGTPYKKKLEFDNDQDAETYCRIKKVKGTIQHKVVLTIESVA